MASERPPAAWNTGRAVAAGWAALTLATIVFYARGATPVVLLGLLTDGGAAALWTASAGFGGAVILRAMGIRCNAALFAATACGVGLGVYSLLLLGIGLAGWLTFGTALGLALLSTAAFAVDAAARRPAWLTNRQVDLGPPRRAGRRWLLLLTAVPAGMALTAGSILPGLLWKPADPHPYDVVEYHLEMPREWYEQGRIGPQSHNVYGYFPFNAEMHALAAMHLRGGPWAGMYQAQYMSVIYAALAALAVYGATRSPSAVAVVAGVPWTVMLAGVAYDESALVLYTALAAAWTLRAMRRRPVRRLILAGATAGLACGVKYTAVPMVLVALAVAAGATVLIDRKPAAWKRRRLIGIGCAGGAALLVLSPWLVRNAVWTGNPVYPLAMNVLGRGGMSAAQVERWNVAHAPPASEAALSMRPVALWRSVLIDGQYGYVLWPLTLAAAVVGMTDSRSRRAALVLVTLLGGMLVVWLFFTHLLGRFMVPAVPVAALLIGRIRLRAFTPVAAAGAGLMLLTTVMVVGPRLGPYADLGRRGFFGPVDLSFMLPKELNEAKNQGRPIVLVGDAGAFFYQVPAGQLHYKAVFNLPADAPSALAAWVDPTLKHPVLVVNPTEVERLHITYRFVPPLSPDVPGPRDRPFVLR